MYYSAFILFKKCVCSQQTSIWKSSPPVGGTSTLKRPFCKGRAIQQKYIYSTTALYNKVHIFWEGHKIFRNLHLTFVLCSASKKVRWRFCKILWPSQNIWTLCTMDAWSELLKISQIVGRLERWPKISKYVWRNNCQDFCYRAEILKIFHLYVGRNDDCLNSFWNLLTCKGPQTCMSTDVETLRQSLC